MTGTGIRGHKKGLYPKHPEKGPCPLSVMMGTGIRGHKKGLYPKHPGEPTNEYLLVGKYHNT